MQILHLSTLHTRTDPRIFTKEAVSLASIYPDEVSYMVADGLGDNLDHGVNIIDLGKLGKGRLNRFLYGNWKAFKKIRHIKPNILHFHDPELMFLGLLAKLSGIKVIYDVHEDVPRHILQKHWIPNVIKRPVSFLMEWLERGAAQVFDAIVTVTPHIAKRFPEQKTILVANFAKGSSILPKQKSASEQMTFIYVGNITRKRGAIEMMEALEMVRDINPKMILAGKFDERGLEETLKQMPAWDRVDFKGWVNAKEVDTFLQKADVGISALHSTPSYDVAYPTKVFEYMKFGLPVIGSKLPTIIEIIGDTNCGLLVDPENSKELAEAMRSLAGDRSARIEMSKNGCKTFDNSYNWDSQVKKLIALYQSLIEK